MAFFLSKLVPGDAAESLLMLQGVNPESDNAKIEYERNYRLLHLDKPLFYFNINPNFFPKNISGIISSFERQQVKALLNQKIPYESIQIYLDDKVKSIQTIKDWNKHIERKQQEKISALLSVANFATDHREINRHWQTLKKTIPDSIQNQCHVFISSANLTTSRVNFYYPNFEWHGKANQFHLWISSILKFDLGLSIKDGGKVSQKIISALKWTILLVIINVLLSSLIAVPSGMIAGFRAGSIYDKSLGLCWLLLYSIPVFWLASLLIIYCTSSKYSALLNIFPVPGLWYIPDGQKMWITITQYSHQLVLPVICLVANDIAQLSRIIRNNVIEQKSKMYVLMAMAKGNNDFEILTKHILPNILIPLVTILGSKIPAGISGALIIEVIFNIPGMGRLMYNSLYYADWNVVFGILIIVSFITMLVMLITDILYTYVNPKIKSSLS